MNYVLYGSPASYYTAKVKSYLKYKQVKFDDKLASILVYRNIIKPKTGVVFIPVVKTPNGNYLQDSTHIIDSLEKKYPYKSVYPESPKQKLACLLLELFGDEWLLLPAMHYRWSFLEENYAFVTHAFGKTAAPNLPSFLQKWIGKKIAKKFSGFVPLLGINEKTIPAIESQFIQLIDYLDEYFKKHLFLLGNRPSLADFSFIGPFRAHLYHDPYPKALIIKKAPRLVNWIERMWSLDQETTYGNWCDNDSVPESLSPIFKILFTDAWPFFKSASLRLNQWLSENPDKRIPRAIGKVSFTVENVQSERLSPTYNQWMLQRPLDFYNAQSKEIKTDLSHWLASFDSDKSIEYKPDFKVTRENNRIVRA